jgi:hypothetical protein
MSEMKRRATRAVAAVGVAATILSTAALGAGLQNNNIGVTTMPFVVTNHTGHPGNLFVYITGLVPSRGNQAYYVSNVNGDLTIVPRADPPGVSLALDLGSAEVTNLQLPQLTAMRIYFSLAAPLLVNATAAGAPPSAPAGWVRADPNFGTIFDWAEFTWNNDPPGTGFQTTIGGNATQVDMFGLAMLIVENGSDDTGNPVSRMSGFSQGRARRQIFRNLRARAPWKRLVIAGTDRRFPLRAVAPYHGISLATFPPNFLQPYINRVWRKYARKTIVAHTQNRTYGGRVDASGALVFNEVGGGDPTFMFARPTTLQAFQNELPAIPNPPTPAGDRARAIGALLAGALMRTNLLLSDNLNACRVRQFYRMGRVNLYARTFHRFGLDHKAYSFGFDDTCDQSSFVQVHDPTSLAITLQGF